MGRKNWEGEERERMVEQVVRMRREGKKFTEIGRALEIRKETARYLFQSRRIEPVRLADVPRARLPMRTLGGMLWQWPPVKPRYGGTGMDWEMGVCGQCELLDECRRRVAQWGKWFTGCERPLEREMA